MASLKELKTRISSVKATQKITKAMKMVAAAKLRRAQEAALAARPYAEKMGAVTANLCEANAGSDTAPQLLVGTGSDERHLLIVCTAERGLCGGFNSSIVRTAKDHAQRLISEGKDVKVLCVGSKGYDILKRLFPEHILDYIHFRDVKAISFAEAQMVGEKVLSLFEEGIFDVATLFYSEFQSVISQIPQAQQIIPATFEEKEEADSGPKGIYEYEPGEEALLATMLPANIRVQIYRALLENAASEQGARMSAMDSATRNAGEMIDKLTLIYNRTRQAIITKELIEIISGAEAL